MPKQVDLFDNVYSNFTERVLANIRIETFGRDIGQNSWITVEEYESFFTWLKIKPEHKLLEVACGAGGPAIYLAEQTNAFVTGIDINENGIATAKKSAMKSKNSSKINFELVNANSKLIFDENSFNGLMCIDSMNHFPDRLDVLKDWRRVLLSGGRAVFTDPIVITGAVSNEEIAVRSSIGYFLFAPEGYNEKLIKQSGFNLIKTEDVTENAALISGRWFEARKKHKDSLIKIEGEERFEGLQKFFSSVHKLTLEKRLSRIAYFVEK